MWPGPGAVEQRGLAWVASVVQWRKSRKRPEPLGASRRGGGGAVESLPLFGRRHFRGGGAPLDVEVAETVPEVGVSGVEGGRLCLQWLHD